MTNLRLTLEAPNSGTRTGAATEAKMRAADEKAAARLRGRGWGVLRPEAVGALDAMVYAYCKIHGVATGDAWEALGLPRAGL